MIVVIGQPRTGTSLTMQMLNAAGAECLGPWPTFEVPFETWSANDFEICGETTAAKYVWHDLPPKAFPANTQFIVTSREPKDQVASERKFLRFFVRSIPAYMDRNEKRRRRRRYIDDQKQIRQLVGASPNMSMPFGGVIRNPEFYARLLCSFLGFGNPDVVANVVVSRDPGNYPGMLEAELIAKRQ